jgi:seryl-tRNA synthetase
MIDIKLIREHPEIVINDLKKRQEFDKIKWVYEIIELDKELHEINIELEKLRHERNELAKKIANEKRGLKNDNL